MTEPTQLPDSNQPAESTESGLGPAGFETLDHLAPVGQARPIELLSRKTLPGLGFELDRNPRAWADVLIFIAVMLAFDLVLGVIAGIFITSAEQPRVNEGLINVAAVLLRAVAAIVVISLILHSHGQTRRSVGLAPNSLAVEIATGFPVTMAAFAMHFLCLVLMWLIYPAIFDGANNAEKIAQMLPQMKLPVLVGFMFLVAFYEELIFRGFLLPRMRAWFRNWPLAVAVSSLLFALPHMANQEAYLVAPLFMLGVVLSVFTIWRRSIVPAIVGHALFNIIQFLAAYSIMPQPTTQPAKPAAASLSLLFSSL